MSHYALADTFHSKMKGRDQDVHKSENKSIFMYERIIPEHKTPDIEL